MINKKTCIETIILYSTDFRNEDCLRTLGDIMKNKNCTLTCLVLSDNDLGEPNELNDSPFKYFLEALKTNNSLIELLLLNCKLKNENVDDICSMLCKNTKLEKLSLYNNLISDQSSFMKILSCLENKESKNKTLKELDLSKNKCNLKMTEEFLHIIKNLRDGIESLDISQNSDFLNEDIEKFVQVIQELDDKIRLLY